MKTLDHFLQDWRIQKAAQHIPPRAHVLDIGSANGRLFQLLHARKVTGTGIDPLYWEGASYPEGCQFHQGSFPETQPDSGPFDTITLLAVIEHWPERRSFDIAAHCYRLLRPFGQVILTIPGPLVDPIVATLKRVGVADGMDFESHRPVDLDEIEDHFLENGFDTVKRSRFQLGLNNLLVFKRRESHGTNFKTRA